MKDKRLAEIVVDDGYPMTDLETELLRAITAERKHVVTQLEAQYDRLIRRDTRNLEKLIAAQAKLEAVKSEIQDCRDAWAPDQPPSDLRQFLIDLESVITTLPESHKPPTG
jgi:hypothetical protein